jgi:hypothetical protein
LQRLDALDALAFLALLATNEQALHRLARSAAHRNEGNNTSTRMYRRAAMCTLFCVELYLEHRTEGRRAHGELGGVPHALGRFDQQTLDGLLVTAELHAKVELVG